MSKEERYAEHTVAWELPKCDSVTKGNYNLADIETKYMPIQTEVVSDSKDKIIADLQSQLAEKEKEIEELKKYKKGAYEKYVAKCKYLQCQIKDLYKSQNQKAIELLEKVKEYNRTLVYGSSLIEKFIDNQINELKGKVE